MSINSARYEQAPSDVQEKEIAARASRRIKIRTDTRGHAGEKAVMPPLFSEFCHLLRKRYGLYCTLISKVL